MSSPQPSLITSLGITAAFLLTSAATTARAQVPAVGQSPATVTCPSVVKGPEARAEGSQVSVPVRDKQIPMDMFYRREGTKIFGTGYAKDGGGGSITTKGDIQPNGTVKVYEVHLEVGYGKLTFDPRDPANFSTNDGDLQTAPAGERNTKFARILDSLQHSEDMAAKAIADKCGAPAITDDPRSAPALQPGTPASTGTPAGGSANGVTWRPDGPIVKDGSITTTFTRYGVDIYDSSNGARTNVRLQTSKGGLQAQTVEFSSPNIMGIELYNPNTGLYRPSTGETKAGARPSTFADGPPKVMATNIAPEIQAALRAVETAKKSSGGSAWNDETFRSVLSQFAAGAAPPGTVRQPAPAEKLKK